MKGGWDGKKGGKGKSGAKGKRGKLGGIGHLDIRIAIQLLPLNFFFLLAPVPFSFFLFPVHSYPIPPTPSTHLTQSTPPKARNPSHNYPSQSRDLYHRDRSGSPKWNFGVLFAPV